ncbi:hypothetical protein D3C72_1471490 [compost metagenome]
MGYLKSRMVVSVHLLQQEFRDAVRDRLESNVLHELSDGCDSFDDLLEDMLLERHI